MQSSNVDVATHLSQRQRSILSMLIDPQHYTSQAGASFESLDELVEHYLQIGWRNRIDPSPTFQSALYCKARPAVCDAGKNPYLHYLFEAVGTEPLAEALSELSEADVGKLRAHFDGEWYARHNRDVDRSINDLFVHYLTYGWRESRDPSRSFSAASYLDLYDDLRDSGLNPFVHWVLHGMEEGRSSGTSVPAPLNSWDSLSASQQAILTQMYASDYYRSQANCDDCLEYHRGLALAKKISSGGSDVGRPTPTFDEARYMATHPEIAAAGHIPFLHYLFEMVGEDALCELFVAQPPVVVQAICDHFDAGWYLYNYPLVEASGQDALIHYLTVGWRQNHDPSPAFSTRAYLLRHTDIVGADLNPFLHWVTYGKLEGRLGASSARNFRNRPYHPRVTAILVNHEASPLTPDGLAAITRQTYANVDILLVGAPLSDECRSLIDAHAATSAGPGLIYLSDERGALPLSRLIERAVERAPGDLLWFVLGSAIPDFQFLARVTSSFADGSVQLAFGRRLEPDHANYAVPEDELARQMEGWARHATSPAAVWFPDHLRSGLPTDEFQNFVWRKRALPSEVWRGANEYQHLALDYLQLHMASGGQIATVRDAVLRVPQSGVPSPARCDDDAMRQDMARLSADVRSVWPVATHASDPAPGGERPRRHILIVTHGIFAGGAENLPIQMANDLVRRGLIVSMLIFRTAINEEMRATLDPGISIYEADWVLEYGRERFIRDIGCSLIHSHGVVSEMFFFRENDGPLPVPYVATLHGSYEASSSEELPERSIAKFVRSVDLFVYTADKNLVPLARHGVRPDQVTKMINAMPIDEEPFPLTRSEMGIADDAIIFTLVARGVKEKGWATAIAAFKSVQARNPDRSMFLCLVGDGDEPTRLKPLYANDESIRFLGFQLRIHGLYRISDVAIVPTRFSGESFPLCIIQALQVGVPIVATDVGEIASMLVSGGVSGGILVEAMEDDSQFNARFAEAMHGLVDDTQRNELAVGAQLLGAGYDMATFTDAYIKLYEEVLHQFAESSRVRAA